MGQGKPVGQLLLIRADGVDRRDDLFLLVVREFLECVFDAWSGPHLPCHGAMRQQVDARPEEARPGRMEHRGGSSAQDHCWTVSCRFDPSKNCPTQSPKHQNKNPKKKVAGDLLYTHAPLLLLIMSADQLRVEFLSLKYNNKNN